MISEKYNFIFFHLPKAAGTSIIAGLKQNLGKSVIKNERNKKLAVFAKQKYEILWPNHVRCSILKDFFGAEVYQSFFKFAFVRNPWDRTVSFYHYTKQKESDIYNKLNIELPKFSKNILKSKSFKDWVKNYEIAGPQYNFLSSTSGELLLDYIGKTENVQTDLSYICGLLNIPNVKLNQLNTTKRKDYRHYYDGETAEIVAKKLKKDIEFFGYDFDGKQVNEPFKKLTNFFPNINYDIVFNKIKNRNRYVKLPEDFQSKRLLLHTNNIGEQPLEVSYLISSKNNIPIEKIRFSVSAHNIKKGNPGSNLKIIIKNPDGGLMLEKNLILTPQKVISVELDIPKTNKCSINFIPSNLKSVNSNNYCGVYVSPLIF